MKSKSSLHPRTFFFSLCLIVFVMCFPSHGFGQWQYADSVHNIVLDGNRVCTILYSYGSLSGPGISPNNLDLAWKGLGYSYEIDFLVGAKVPVAGSPGDSVAVVSESAFGSADGDFGPGGKKWGWSPRPGYAAPGQPSIAVNTSPCTWSPSWNAWPGRFGPGKTIADHEVLFGMDDYPNAEFPYYPFPDDSTKKGLGLSAEVRAYQFEHPNLADVLFVTYDLHNDSPRRLDRVVAGIFLDPHIGGFIDYSDDIASSVKSLDLGFFWDADGVSCLPGVKPGYLGIQFVETPCVPSDGPELGLTSFAAPTFAGTGNRPKDDASMYQKMTPGYFQYQLPDSSIAEDNVGILGTGYFPLDTGGCHATLGVAFILADDRGSLFDRAGLVAREYGFLFTSTGKGDPAIATPLSAPSAGDTVNGNIAIAWTGALAPGDTSIELYYSNTYDQEWHCIARGVQNTGSYQWNTTQVRDGIFYKIHILNRVGDKIAYDSTDRFFVVNNAGDEAPELVLLDPVRNLLVSDTLRIRWVAGDAEGDPVTLDAYFSADGGQTFTLLGHIANSGFADFSTRAFPNSPNALLRLVAEANGKYDTTESSVLTLRNSFLAVPDSAVHHVAGVGTGLVAPVVVDTSALTGHRYRVSFDSLGGSPVYSVLDLTTAETKVDRKPYCSISGGGDSFDGLRMTIRDEHLTVDSIRSGFIGTPPSGIAAEVASGFVGSVQVKYAPVDVQVIFNCTDATSDGSYLFPGDSLKAVVGSTKVQTPLRISIPNDTTHLTCLVMDSGVEGRWDPGDAIIVTTPRPYGDPAHNSFMKITFADSIAGQPFHAVGGETYLARTMRPFTRSDAFEFDATKTGLVPAGVPGRGSAPVSFALNQNFPNPFNPQTTITFSIPKAARTTLRIYDALGREVASLVDGFLSSGEYRVTWDASRVSSGVYFYRLQSGGSACSRKMVVLK